MNFLVFQMLLVEEGCGGRFALSPCSGRVSTAAVLSELIGCAVQEPAGQVVLSPFTERKITSKAVNIRIDFVGLFEVYVLFYLWFVWGFFPTESFLIDLSPLANYVDKVN